MSTEKATATLAGGCFWCLEAVFLQMRGVETVDSGYMGGHTVQPTYEEVCSGETGHAEVVRLTYDPAVVGYRDLLEVFFGIHDPTTLNRQGNDVGTQYRSAIYTHSAEQAETARALIAEMTADAVFDAPTVVVVGSEGRGIREKTLDLCDFSLSIPISDACESLNASNAVAVTLYEWSKQNK